MSNWRTTKAYRDMLTLMGSLSRLYSESDMPFIYYRVTENLFCKYCNAKNLSRDDMAYDFVDKESIEVIGETDKALHFKDKRYAYTFSRSKSVLMSRWEAIHIKVQTKKMLKPL